MNTGPAALWSLLVTLAFVALVIAGCATTKPIDWNSRVGSYTFDQAVTELGPPDKQAKLSDGRTVAEWITHREGGTSFSVGTGFRGRQHRLRCRPDRRNGLPRPGVDPDLRHEQCAYRVVKELLNMRSPRSYRSGFRQEAGPFPFLELAALCRDAATMK
jgi:hypothetical protein